MKKFNLVGLSALGLSAFIYRSNHRLQEHFIEIENSKINTKLRIVHLSDCHIPYQTVNLERIVNEVKKLHPDLIVITGDLLDRDHQPKDLETLHRWISKLAKLCLVVACEGNHDYRMVTSQNDRFIICRDESIHLTINETELQIIGVKPMTTYQKEVNKDRLTLVLDHYPQNVSLLKIHQNIYQFSGHVHGGQFRFFNQGVYGPGQGFFPKYSKGYYGFSEISGLIVSAGLGASMFPLRLNNPNHLVVVDFLGLRYNK